MSGYTKRTAEGDNPDGSSCSVYSEALRDVEFLKRLRYHFLCEGSAADVYVSYNSETSSSVMENIKVVKKQIRVVPSYFTDVAAGQGEDILFDLRKTFARESALWMSLRHPNIVQLYAAVPDEFTLYQEHCLEGALRQYVEHGIPNGVRNRIVEDVLTGLAYLHGQNPPIVHGNVNPGKIYIAPDKKAKLGEFGLSRLASPFPQLVPSINLDGMARWTSPEYFVSKLETLSESDSESEPDTEEMPLTTQLDMWSFGCTLQEIVTGRLPYYQCNYDAQVIRHIISGNPPGQRPNQQARDENNAERQDAEAIWKLIEKCWLPVGQRPSPKELIEEFALVSRNDIGNCTNNDTTGNTTSNSTSNASYAMSNTSNTANNTMSNTANYSEVFRTQRASSFSTDDEMPPLTLSLTSEFWTSEGRGSSVRGQAHHQSAQTPSQQVPPGDSDSHQ